MFQHRHFGCNVACCPRPPAGLARRDNMSSASLLTTWQHMLDTHLDQRMVSMAFPHWHGTCPAERDRDLHKKNEWAREHHVSTEAHEAKRGYWQWPAECDRHPASRWMVKKYARVKKHHQEVRDAAASTEADSAKRLQHPTPKTSPVGVQAASATSSEHLTSVFCAASAWRRLLACTGMRPGPR